MFGERKMYKFIALFLLVASPAFAQMSLADAKKAAFKNATAHCTHLGKKLYVLKEGDDVANPSITGAFVLPGGVNFIYRCVDKG
jgi:hypothetical protein